MYYNIIFLEGVKKIGKSSQCVLIKQDFSKDREVKKFDFDTHFNPTELSNKIDELRNWCLENPKGLALVNGSVAYSIIHQDLSNGKYGSSYAEFEIPIKNFFNLLKDFKTVSVLLNSNDYNYLENRLNEGEIFNIIEYQKTYDGFMFFENSQINYNFKWEHVNISQFDTILKIHDKIRQVIE